MRALVVIALLASAAPVSAEPVPEKARQLADRGRILHDAGDYVDAIAAFNEAYVLAPSPGLLFNLAQAYRLAGKCDDAAWMYRRFLDSRPSVEKRQLAETHLAAVEKCGHGGLRVAMIPAPPVMSAAIPEPRIETAAAPPLALHLQPIESHTGQRDKRIGIGLGIGGGVLLAAAGYFAWDAHEASDTVSSAYAQGKKWSDVASTDQRGQHSASMAEAFGVVGGLAVASGAVMYLIGRHHEHVAVTPTAGGAGIRMSWGF